LAFDYEPRDPHRAAEAFREQLKRWTSRKLLIPIAVVVIMAWLATGIYVVGPGEVGVVLQFGRHVAVTQPGLNYRLPRPIQNHYIVDVRAVRSTEIGYRTVTQRSGQTVVQRVPAEALMLTGDENIVEVQLFVQYIIQDPVKYLFRARAPEETLAAAAEVALRSVVGRNTIDHTMTEGRVEVQTQVAEYLQKLLDEYETGLLATEVRLLVVDAPDQVRPAFHDVVRAWEDRERMIQEAEGYREDVIPRARGEAQEIIRAAEAYAERRVLMAQGEAARFVSVLNEYKQAPEVTRDRIYLETMEEILPDASKFILSTGAGEVLPLLPLKQLFDGSPAQGGDRR
jgi:HflK protein